MYLLQSLKISHMSFSERFRLRDFMDSTSIFLTHYIIETSSSLRRITRSTFLVFYVPLRILSKNHDTIYHKIWRLPPFFSCSRKFLHHVRLG
mmetsp:Transcript_316/g.441  ORF Transcript_316/g.441 Transcript_316/m.441 type:complete len:92 (+) Transcript_316:269-544(+)